MKLATLRLQVLLIDAHYLQTKAEKHNMKMSLKKLKYKVNIIIITGFETFKFSVNNNIKSMMLILILIR